MRSPPTLAIAALVAAAAFSTGAQAQDNPWCAFFSGATTNCAFATLQDCMKAIQGKTGLCDRKPQNVPLDLDPPATGPGLAAAGNGCAARFRSYDPASGTYLGIDGRRHRCRRRHHQD
jgi:hypothetical protein